MPKKSRQPRKARIKWVFSPKQLFAMYWWQLPQCMNADGFFADGSVRSGKTVSMSIGFVLWAMTRFDGYDFIMCGKTIKAFERNVLTPLKSYLPCLDLTIAERKSDSMFIITDTKGRSNNFYLFGGKDEASQALVQGMTAAGAYFDEIVLMPESFVNQVMTRCSITGAKIWANCNPEGNTHYIKTDYIDQYRERNLVHCHFTMDDNYSLSDERRAYYKRQYRSGVFYRRFILGEWCLADGLIYTAFDPDRMIIHDPIDYSAYSELMVGYDYGIQNPTAFVMVGYHIERKRVEVVKTWGYSGRDMQEQKTDPELYEDLLAFVGTLPVSYVYGDPSATSFHAMIRKKGEMRDKNANNAVSEGIQFVSSLFDLGQLYIHESCTGLLKELSAYSWDSEKSQKEGKDIVLKQSDHYCDALRYVLYTYYYAKAKSYRLGAYAN